MHDARCCSNMLSASCVRKRCMRCGSSRRPVLHACLGLSRVSNFDARHSSGACLGFSRVSSFWFFEFFLPQRAYCFFSLRAILHVKRAVHACTHRFLLCSPRPRTKNITNLSDILHHTSTPKRFHLQMFGNFMQNAGVCKNSEKF